jgi:hypothetical protein
MICLVFGTISVSLVMILCKWWTKQIESNNNQESND